MNLSKLAPAQRAEIEKYSVTYEHPKYRMSQLRQAAASVELRGLRLIGASYLDVSCGRAEMLHIASSLGYREVAGTEVVDSLIKTHRIHNNNVAIIRALAWELPFVAARFDVVSMFDVIEHLLPGDDERACRELARVAGRHVIITANNRPSFHEGIELHVNRRPYDEWDSLFREWFPGRVHWRKRRVAKHSEMWRVDLA